MFAEHLNGESPVRTTVKERTVDQWEQKPNEPDNHLFDTTVLSLVGLSMQGCALPGGHETEHVRRREPRRISSASINKRR